MRQVLLPKGRMENEVPKSGWGISVAHSGHAAICQYYASTQATEQHTIHPPLSLTREVLLFLLVGFEFGVEDLMLGLGMGLRFVLY